MLEIHNKNATRSYWTTQTRAASHEPLSNDINVDVAIVGAGIAGLSVAYTLAKSGKSVAVLEKNLVGSGETSRTTAHLSAYADGPFREIKRKLNIDAVKLLAQSHIHAISNIEKIINEENISCNFKRVDGYLFSGDDSSNALSDEAKILEEIDVLPFAWVERAPFTNFDTGRAIKFPNQAQFHPLKYLLGLDAAINKYAGAIYEGTHVTSIEDKKTCVVKTADGPTVRAAKVVVTTNSPINDRVKLHTKLTQYRSYAIVLSVPRGEIEEALYWDTADPYHYVRTVPSPNEEHDYILIGGGDHKTGQKKLPQQAFSALLKWAAHRFSKHEVIFEWSGQIVEPVDGVAFIGKNPRSENVFVHTGMSGSGLTYGALAGTLLPELIFEKKSLWQELYDPSRKPKKALGAYFTDFLNVAAQYADWVKPHKWSTKKIEPGSGAVVRRGLHLDAVFKDSDGKTLCMSATCPHLGGVVRWNSLEKTWDCPCHGSRFRPDGTVINGPANSNLTKC